MNIDFDRLKYSLTGEYEEVMLEKQLKEKEEEIERLNKELQDTKEHLGEYLHEQEEENKLLSHRLEVANEYIESRKENMIPEHYDDLKYIINECDLDSTW